MKYKTRHLKNLLKAIVYLYPKMKFVDGEKQSEIIIQTKSGYDFRGSWYVIASSRIHSKHRRYLQLFNNFFSQSASSVKSIEDYEFSLGLLGWIPSEDNIGQNEKNHK